MELNLATALGQVKLAMMDAAEKSAKRRLTVLSKTAPCKPGCDGCCSRMVFTTVAEAIVIQEHLRRTGQWDEVRARATVLAVSAKAANAVSWFKMNLKCPILDPKARTCLAYGVRPTPCSAHYVTSDPALCDPWSTKGGEYRPVDMEDVHDEAVKRIESKLDGHGILAFRLPLPIGLLFAERVKYQKGMTANEVMSFIFNELK